MSKSLATLSHHIVLELLLKLGTITLVRKLNEVRILHREFELAARLLEVFYDVVSAVILTFIIDKDPFLLVQIHCFLNRQLSESFLVASDQLVASDELRSFKNIGLHSYRG